MKLTNTFTGGIMNKDLDERLIPKGQYRDGLNVGVSTSEESSVGAIENFLGNTLVGSATYNGMTTDAVTIGAYADDARETLYWFVADTAFDYIIKYSSNTGTSTIILQDFKGNTLKFNKEYIITGVNLVGDLLFWTDNLNPPRRLNIRRFYLPNLTALSANFTEDDIAVILRPPLSSPVISMVDTGTLTDENFIQDKFLRFAYRFRYENNEYSSMSPFSATAFNAKKYEFNYSDGDFVSMLNEFNQVDVTIETGTKQVKNVQLVITNELTSQVFIVETYNKEANLWADNTTETVSFNNSKLYSLLAADEVTRLYDAVPLKAQAQDFVGSRIMYGNYIQGNNIVNDKGESIPMDFSLDYYSAPLPTENNPFKTFRSDRDYEVAIAYSDEYGRLTTPLIPTISNQFSNTTYIPATESVNSNDLRVSINNRPPEFAYHYRIFIKQNEYKFTNIFPSFYYIVSGVVYFRIDRSDVNKVKVGEYIICKLNDGIATKVNTEFKVLNVEVQDKDFLGNNEISGLYMEIADPNGFFSVSNTFSEAYTARGLWNNYSETFASVYGGETRDRDPIAPNGDRVAQVDNPIHYGTSTTNTNLALITGAGATSPYDPIFSSVQNDQRIKIKIRPGDNFEVFHMSTSGGYVLSTGISPIDFVNGNVINATTGIPVCKVSWVDGPGYISNDFFIINVHSRRKPGNESSVLNQDMEVNLYQSEVINLQHTTTTYSRVAIVASNAVDTFRIPTNSPPDREIEAGAVIEITITESSHEQSTLPSSLSGVQDPYPNLQASGTPSSTMTFISSREYKNIEEWFYEDRIYLQWEHTDFFSGGSQKGAQCRVLFKRGFWSQPGGGNTEIFEHPLMMNGWTNEMYQKVAPAAPGGYPDWASYLANEAPVRLCVVASYNPAWTSASGFNNVNIANIAVNFQINQAERGSPVFETIPESQDLDLFYETPFTFNIDRVNNLHEGNVQNQSANVGGVPAIVSLNTATLSGSPTKQQEENASFNAFAWGNGVESMTIRGGWNEAQLQYSPRVSIPIEDYGQELLTSSITYSGVFRENTTVNNLNEFNLSLANYKDLQKEYGPIRKLHARDSDVVAFQEDKVSKILFGKNLLSDSTGGGNVASVPEVLGTQITYLGEYGISENPESFASWGNDMYFADAKRGAVCRLGANGIFEISSQGMSDYFKDLFRDNFRTQKLGVIDPFKEHYVLSSNDTPAPPCEFDFVIETTDVPGPSIQLVNINVTSTANWTLTLVDTGDGIGWATLNATTPTYTGFGNEVVTLKISPNLTTFKRSLDILGTGCAGALPAVSITQGTGSKLTRGTLAAGLEQDSVEGLESSFEYESTSAGLVPFNNQRITPNSLTTFVEDNSIALTGTNTLPFDGETVTMRATQTGALGRKSFEPNLGNKMKYLVTDTLYTTSQVTAALAAATAITPSLVAGKWEGTFTFLRPADEKYLYLLYDMRSTFTSGDTMTFPAAINNHIGTFNADLDLTTQRGRLSMAYTPCAGGNNYQIYKGDNLIVESGLVTVAGTLDFVKKNTDSAYSLKVTYPGDGNSFTASIPTPTLTSFTYDNTDESLDPSDALYVCRATATPPTSLKYHDGPDPLPKPGNTVYENPFGGLVLDLGNTVHRMGTVGFPDMNWLIGDTAGVVSDTGQCAACTEVATPVYNGSSVYELVPLQYVSLKLELSNNPSIVETTSLNITYTVTGGVDGGTVTFRNPTNGQTIIQTIPSVSSLYIVSDNVPTSTGTVTVVSKSGQDTQQVLPVGLSYDNETFTVTGTPQGNVGGQNDLVVPFRATNCFGSTNFNVTFRFVTKLFKKFLMDATQFGNTTTAACALTATNVPMQHDGVNDFPVIGNRIFSNTTQSQGQSSNRGQVFFRGGYSYFKVANGTVILIDDYGFVQEIFTCP